APFAPHITEELWAALGRPFSIHNQAWPEFDKNLVFQEEVVVAVQVDGKTRSTITVAKASPREELSKAAKTAVVKYLGGRSVVKEIIIPGKVVNFVTK
ncbi:MAG: class I tRNA ligase family protein, partial [bacterium]